MQFLVCGTFKLLAVMPAQKREDKCWMKSTPEVWLWKQRHQGIFSSEKFMGVFSGLQQVNALWRVCGGIVWKRYIAGTGWSVLAVLTEGGLWVYWMNKTVSQLYFLIMMTVISIEKLTSGPLVNVFWRENSDCYMVIAFRSHSECQSYFFAKLSDFLV